MKKLTDRFGPWALVTGATAGIGHEFAKQLAADGMNIVLVARRRALLEQRAGEIAAKYGVETLTVALDLSRDGFMTTLRAATEGLLIGVVINNAGTGVLGEFLGNDIDRELDILNLNTRAPLLISHAYGREMAQRGRGALLIVSSVMGVLATPRFAHYAATKAYGLLLAESLRAELHDQGVDVLALLPGFTRSEFVDNLDLSKLPMPIADPQHVVAAALRGIGRSSVVVPGLMNRILFAMAPFLPRAFKAWMMGMIMKRVGRKSVPRLERASA
ncbi:MAG: SDR family NAD(P)-dependent oxidoreductase [Planctomycetes bacterium]|nr:SDR family NAD(P)-dependent oxidoreductase [Planctomycetota bacterium]